MTIIHFNNVLLEDIYVNNTDSEHAVGFGFSSLNVVSTPNASRIKQNT